jgi:hypothetical protein
MVVIHENMGLTTRAAIYASMLPEGKKDVFKHAALEGAPLGGQSGSTDSQEAQTSKPTMRSEGSIADTFSEGESETEYALDIGGNIRYDDQGRPIIFHPRADVLSCSTDVLICPTESHPRNTAEPPWCRPDAQTRASLYAPYDRFDMHLAVFRDSVVELTGVVAENEVPGCFE